MTGGSQAGRNGVARAAAAAIVLTVVFYVWPLTLDAPVIDPDEGLHAAIAQEMLDRGDAVMPRFLGEPFLDKPILYFWALMASLRALGASELAVRLPGLLFGWLGTLTTALGRDLSGSFRYSESNRGQASHVRQVSVDVVQRFGR